MNPDHLRYFKFIGRVVGKALFEECLLDAYFTRSFYKHIAGESLTIHDMEDIDPDYYKNLTWILNNDITGMDLTFSYETNNFGEIKEVDLIENGRDVEVTEENKKEYVQ